MALPLGRLGRAADDLQPDRARPRERDRVDPGVPDEHRAGITVAGHERERTGGNARVAERLDQAKRAAGRLLGGLEDDRVAGGQSSRRHSGRDREREVPGRDDRNHAARPVRHRVALAGDLRQRRAVAEPDGLARVVLAEVDRLADVRVGLGPRLRALPHCKGG